VREKVFPVAARDLAGRDVRALVLEADRRGTGCEKDPRWPGYAKEHALELDFGDRRPAGEVFLFLDGWVEYTYSRFNYAAHQAGVRLEAPSLEVPDGNGGWRTVLRELGYPAGLPRTMTVPLPAEAGARFRLRTNMEVSWDRAFLARDLGAAAVRVTVLEAREATLRACGYPREFSPDGRDPTTYDYERREAGVTFRDLTGAYTRFGDVRELLLEADDRYAIFGRGEEVAAAFPALPPVAAGRARTYVLRSFGWCKDRDPYTAFPDTVEPLPFRGMGAYPYGPGARPADPAGFEAARRAWHTRRIR
jgi:hypothetical protein